MVVGEVAAAAVGGEPDISDTRLIGTRFLSDWLRRLYGWKRRGRGLAPRRRREDAVVFHSAREKAAAWASVEAEQLNLLLLLLDFSPMFTMLYINMSLENI